MSKQNEKDENINSIWRGKSQRRSTDLEVSADRTEGDNILRSVQLEVHWQPMETRLLLGSDVSNKI